MILLLERTYHLESTTSILMLGGEFFSDAIERPWRNNQPNISCIPEGTYTLHRDRTGRHRYFRVEDEEVAPRSAIEIHPVEPGPCRVPHLQGCICPGELVWQPGASDSYPTPTIEDSRATCDRLVVALSDSEVHTLVIRQWRPTGMEIRP